MSPDKRTSDRTQAVRAKKKARDNAALHEVVGGLRHVFGRSRAVAARVWDRGFTRAKQVVVWMVTVLPPNILIILWVNKTRVTRQPSVPAERIRRAQGLDPGASIALWQADTDRLNGLAAKAAAVLAADALIAAGLVTQTDSRGWTLLVCVVCVAYLVSASTAACLVQMPMSRQSVLPEHVLDGDVERRMIEAVVGNEPLSTRTQNLVYVAVRDTFVSLVALLLVFLLNLNPWG